MTQVLNKPVLVLNKNWTVIGTTNVMKAIDIMCRGRGRALCTTTFVPYTWEDWIDAGDNLKDIPFYIKTSSISVPAPQVIVLTAYNHLHQKGIKFSPQGVKRRDEFVCQYCSKRFKSMDLSLDHVLPKSRQGPNTWENCVAACLRCNNRKADKTPREPRMPLKKKPLRPKWNPVFDIKKENRPKAWKALLRDNW